MSRFVDRIRGLFSSPSPSIGLEISAGRVSAVALAWRNGSPKIVGFGSACLEPGLVVPSPTGNNIRNIKKVGLAVSDVVKELRIRGARVGLIVPDIVAKVSLVQLDQVPGRVADLEKVLSWRIGRTVPFPMEEARLVFAEGLSREDGIREFIVTVVRREVIEEYESACILGEIQVGLLDICTFNVINSGLALSEPVGADWFVLNLSDGCCTLAIMRNQQLVLFRAQTVESHSDLAGLVHQTVMYYEDHLDGPGLSRIVLVNAGLDMTLGETARRILEEQFGEVVTSIVPQEAARRIVDGSAPLDQLAGPMGLIIRERLRSAA